MLMSGVENSTVLLLSMLRVEPFIKISHIVSLGAIQVFGYWWVLVFQGSIHNEWHPVTPAVFKFVNMKRCT